MGAQMLDLAYKTLVLPHPLYCARPIKGDRTFSFFNVQFPYLTRRRPVLNGQPAIDTGWLEFRGNSTIYSLQHRRPLRSYGGSTKGFVFLSLSRDVTCAVKFKTNDRFFLLHPSGRSTTPPRAAVRAFFRVPFPCAAATISRPAELIHQRNLITLLRSRFNVSFHPSSFRLLLYYYFVLFRFNE